MEKYAGYMPRRHISFASINPYLRTALIPGIQFEAGPIHVRVNRFGFRGDEFSMPKTPGSFRIFTLGESSTFGWKGVKSHEQAWPALLEGKLRIAYPNHKIEVINAGVPGYTSVEQRVNFLLRISRLEPDALLIYHGNNDINWSWVPDVETKTIYGREAGKPTNTLWNRIFEHSYVYMEVRSRIGKLEISNRIKRDEPDPAALDMLKTNLKELITDAKREGLNVAIGTFAHALDVDGQPGHYSYDEKVLGVPGVGVWFDNLSSQGVRRSFPLYNANIRDLAKSERIPLVDLLQVIPPTPEFHTDWCHLTARGHEAVAAAWLGTIKQADWIQ